MDYDAQFLQREYLEGLKGPARVGWVSIDEVRPQPFQEVLICGPVHKHAVGYIDCFGGHWVVGDKPIGFSQYPHWQPLPAPPFYE